MLYSETPELVDMKITNKCFFGCSFCYQNSNPEGLNGDFDYIQKLIKELRKLETFEIAYGGGETTIHPNFYEILKYTKDNKIVPNFTTRSLDWIEKGMGNKYLDLCGGCAFSISNSQDLENLIKLLKKYNIKNIEKKIYIHIVMGTINENEFKKMLLISKENNITSTLLGFKQFGRGKSYYKINYDWWFDIANKIKGKIGIDTLLASQYQNTLKRYLDKKYYYTEEGRFSCYIDAVNKNLSICSYSEKDEIYDLKNPKDILKNYSKFNSR